MKANWLSTLFVALTASSSYIRQRLWKWVYNNIARKDISGKFIFMNYGYDNKTDTPLFLNQQDEPHRYFIQLSHHVIKDIVLQDKTIIEIGCGRGGGGNFLLRHKKPSAYIGIDLSETAIQWCQQHYKCPQAQWMQGSADALPLSDNSADIVINVESSHCYPSMEKFLREVKRVLRPKGYMAFCDLRPFSEIKPLENAILGSDLTVIHQADITTPVLAALDKISSTREKEIRTVFPRLFYRAIRDFAAVKNTTVYNKLKSGEIKYLCYLLQK